MHFVRSVADRLRIHCGVAAGILVFVLSQSACAQEGWPNLADRNPAHQRELAPKLERIPKSHPRIFIRTEDDLEKIRRRIKSDPNLAKAYGRLLEWARTDQYWKNLWLTGSQLQAAVLAYRLEHKDPKIKKHCLRIMDFLLSPKGHRLARPDKWTWPRVAKSLAMAYDWMYDDLTPAERKLYGERAIYAAKQCYRTLRHTTFNNHLYLKYGPVLYVGVGLYGDGIDDAAARQLALDGLELLFKHFNPAHEFVGMGDGGWHESMSYNAFFTYEYAHVIELWSKASGENLWKDFRGLDGDAHFQDKNLRPFDRYRVHVADTGHASAVDRNVLAYLPLLSRARRDGLARTRADWIIEQLEAESRAGRSIALDGHRFWPYVLWYDPTVPAVEVEKLPLARVFRGVGWVSMRSSWEKDATFALFTCPPTWFGGHQHCDSNSFIIHKYALLALDTGVYIARGHRGNYYSRTIAHNSVTIFDPEETFTGGTWGTSQGVRVTNDGGQMYMGSPRFVGEVGPGTKFDRGMLLAYELTDHYTYAAGDATKAYSKHKLKEFTRAFLHLRPDVFVVFDRVESTRSEYKKRWLLHSHNEPEIMRDSFAIANEPGKLWGKTLLPKDAAFETIGGPGREFWVDGRNWPPQKGVHDSSGRWRLEVSPSAAAKRDYFLHVLYATSSQSTTYPKARLSEKEGHVTATVIFDEKIATVTFAKEGPLAGSIRIATRDGEVLSDRKLTDRLVLDAQLTEN